MIVVDPVTMLVFEIACLWFFIICGVLCFHLGFLSDWWGPLTEVFLILIGIRVASLDLEYVRSKGRRLLSFAVIVLFSYVIEVVGVHTGRPFGEYNYTPELGLALYGVPVVIPIAWLSVVICAANMARVRSLGYAMLFGGLLVCLFDVALEPAARVLNLWTFDGGDPPLRNYLSWAVFGAVLIGARRIIEGEVWNREPSRLFYHVFLVQLAYFIGISVPY
jgi:putative membrane protein